MIPFLLKETETSQTAVNLWYLPSPNYLIVQRSADVKVYTYSSGSGFTLATTIAKTDVVHAYGDGTYIYLSRGANGVEAYDPSGWTLKDTFAGNIQWVNRTTDGTLHMGGAGNTLYAATFNGTSFSAALDTVTTTDAINSIAVTEIDQIAVGVDNEGITIYTFSSGAYSTAIATAAKANMTRVDLLPVGDLAILSIEPDGLNEFARVSVYQISTAGTLNQIDQWDTDSYSTVGDLKNACVLESLYYFGVDNGTNNYLVSIRSRPVWRPYYEFDQTTIANDGRLPTSDGTNLIAYNNDPGFEELTAWILQRVNELIVSSWDFGDGDTSPEHHPVHRYGAVGVYTVTLTIYHEGYDPFAALETDSSLGESYPFDNVVAYEVGEKVKFINRSGDGGQVPG